MERKRARSGRQTEADTQRERELWRQTSCPVVDVLSFEGGDRGGGASPRFPRPRATLGRVLGALLLEKKPGEKRERARAVFVFCAEKKQRRKCCIKIKISSQQPHQNDPHNSLHRCLWNPTPTDPVLLCVLFELVHSTTTMTVSPSLHPLPTAVEPFAVTFQYPGRLCLSGAAVGDYSVATGRERDDEQESYPGAELTWPEVGRWP